jgi:large repetitive protein
MNFNRKSLSLWASIALAFFFYGASPALAQISLGTAQSFAVLGGSTVTNTGSSTVTGNLGVSPGTSVTGFPPGIVTGGTIHLNDAAAAQAQSDLTTAYNAILGTACTVDLTGQNLGGLTLTPGVYCFSSAAQLTGTLTLNALGNSNALFIFKIGSTLTTASSSSVQVINPGSGSNCNVFWQVGASATLGTGTSFLGNILALSSITLTTGANVSGRILARNGAVTMDTNNVTVCGPTIACPVITVNPATLPNGVLGTPYSQTVSAVGGTAPYTFTVSSGALPNGLTLNATSGVISGTPTAAGTFNFIITATDANSCPGSRPYTIGIAGAPGCPVITVHPATLPPGVIGTPYSQTVSATGGTAPYTFTVSSGALPPGLTLNATTGVISGTPTTAGQFSFTITATDANSCPGSQPYSIVIPILPGCPFITVSPATLPPAVLGVFYSQTITASGGTPPFTFTVSSGALPPGLTLSATSSTTAVISGTPTTNGLFSFTITATDANGCPGSRTYSLQLPAPVPPVPPGGSVPTLSEWGAILMALLIIAACTFFLVGHSKAAMSFAGAVPSTAFTGAEKALDWKLMARTAMYVEAGIALALIALSANRVDILGALTSGLVVAFILHLLIGGARRR